MSESNPRCASCVANGCKTTCSAKNGKLLCYAYRLAMAVVLLTDHNRDAATVALGVILLGLLFIISYVADLKTRANHFKLYYWFLLPLECIFLLVCVAHANNATAYNGAGGIMLVNIVVCVVHEQGWCGYSQNI